MESVDKSAKWTRVAFHPTDAVEVTSIAGDGKQIRGIRKLHPHEQPSDDSRVLKNGWDHEHCEICNAHIDPGDYAYANPEDHWVCLNCFQK